MSEQGSLLSLRAGNAFARDLILVGSISVGIPSISFGIGVKPRSLISSKERFLIVRARLIAASTPR